MSHATEAKKEFTTDLTEIDGKYYRYGDIKKLASKEEIAQFKLKAVVNTPEIQQDIAQAATVLENSTQKTLKTFVEFMKSRLELGTKDKPLIYGKFTVVSVSVDSDNKLEIETEVDTIDKDSKRGMTIPDKTALKDIISQTQAFIKDEVKAHHNGGFAKDMTNYNKMLQEVSILIESPGDKLKISPDLRKQFRNNISVIYKLSSKFPTFAAQHLTESVKLARVILGYTSFILRQYKSQV